MSTVTRPKIPPYLNTDAEPKHHGTVRAEQRAALATRYPRVLHLMT